MPSTLQISASNAPFGYTHDNMIKAVTACAQGVARLTYATVTIDAMTDNSTGVAGASITALSLPALFTHVTGSDMAQKAALDTAIGKIENVQAVFGTQLNLLLAKSGVGTITHTGTVATPGTIPAMDKVVTGDAGDGTTAAEGVSARTQLKGAIDSQARLIRAYNILATNVGFTTLTDNTGGELGTTPFVLADLAATGTGIGLADQGVSKAATDTLLTALANNYALLADNVDALVAFLDSAPAIAVAVTP